MSKIEVKEVHVKLPIHQYKFMMKFKGEFKIGMTDFIIKAIEEKIINLKK